jgi:hypothetical protein
MTKNFMNNFFNNSAQNLLPINIYSIEQMMMIKILGALGVHQTLIMLVVLFV